MTILCISDTHGDFDALAEIVKQNLNGFDLLLFAGDGAADLLQLQKSFPKQRVEAVAGNCDGDCGHPDVKLLSYKGTNILLTHGHRFDVKRGLERLEEFAKQNFAAAVVFGHTHLPEIVLREGVLFVNPGTASPFCPRGGCAAGYAVMTVEEGKQPFARSVKI